MVRTLGSQPSNRGSTPRSGTIMPKIYTKTGDRGETGLGNGRRVSKDYLRIEAIGAVDEVNAWIGMVQTQNSKLKSQNHNSKLKTNIADCLRKIQNNLFYTGALLGKAKIDNHTKLVRILTERTRELENDIDTLTNELPPLTNFILPGGSVTGAEIHVARTVCRRAERRVVSLMKAENDESLAPVIMYLNRLSDFLFTLARFVNMQAGVEEEKWIL